MSGRGSTDSGEVGSLYLLHIEPRYLHAGHYLGWATNVERRVAEHLSKGNRSSPLIRAALEAGSSVELVLTIPEQTRTDERRAKRRGGLGRLCPPCRAAGYSRR